MKDKSQTAAEARAEWNKIVEERYAPTWGTTALGNTAMSEREESVVPDIAEVFERNLQQVMIIP